MKNVTIGILSGLLVVAIFWAVTFKTQYDQVFKFLITLQEKNGELYYKNIELEHKTAECVLEREKFNALVRCVVDSAKGDTIFYRVIKISTK